MPYCRTKICGITSKEDAAHVLAAGADAMGLVFYPPSPRAVTYQQAAEIVNGLGPFLTLVGLFVNATKEQIEQVLAVVPLHVLQFHGDETPEFCRSFGRPFMKALRMKAGIDVSAEVDRFIGASGILLDAYQPGVPGGTGETFDWQRVPRNSATPIILAGGLTPENVASAVQQTAVYGVDVSGGVERSPGIKDAAKIQAFIDSAKFGS